MNEIVFCFFLLFVFFIISLGTLIIIFTFVYLFYDITFNTGREVIELNRKGTNSIEDIKIFFREKDFSIYSDKAGFIAEYIVPLNPGKTIFEFQTYTRDNMKLYKINMYVKIKEKEMKFNNYYCPYYGVRKKGSVIKKQLYTFLKDNQYM